MGDSQHRGLDKFSWFGRRPPMRVLCRLFKLTQLELLGRDPAFNLLRGLLVYRTKRRLGWDQYATI